jgi:hypothetical protein
MNDMMSWQKESKTKSESESRDMTNGKVKAGEVGQGRRRLRSVREGAVP